MSDERAEKVRKRSKIGVGFPQITMIECWGRMLYEAFGAMPYHVGSSLNGKDWRDVDVRIMLTDDEWKRLFGDTVNLHPRRLIAPWSVLCTAISVWGEQWTGLPIDFQFQTITEGNSDPNAVPGSRNPIGISFISDEDIERLAAVSSVEETPQ